MKHILIILKCPITNQGRMINFTKSLSKFHKLTIFSLYDGNTFETNSNIEHHTYQLKKNFLNKLLKHTLFWLEYHELPKIIKLKITKKKYDYILCHDLPVLFPAYKLKRHYKSKLIYDSLEIYNETINQFFPLVRGLKKISSFFLIKFMKWNGQIAEKHLMKKCDIIITVNNSLGKYFEKKYSVDNVKVVMNCPPLLKEKASKIDLKKMLNFKNEDKIFIYQGHMNEGRGLEMLINGFFKTLKKHSNIKLIFIGDGPLKTKLEKQVSDLELCNDVKFIGSVPYEKLLNYTISADFGINLLESFNLSKKFASPNKLFEYIQAGIPVLCSFSPENDIVLNHYNIGEQCQNNIDDISNGLIKLIEIKLDNYNNYKTNIQKAQNIYNWEAQEKILISLL